MSSARERAGDIGVNEAAGVRRRVEFAIVGWPGRMRFSAGSAAVEPSRRKGGRCIRGELRELMSETRGSDMQASVQTDGCISRRHDADVVPRARGMDCHCARRTRRKNVFSYHNSPHIQAGIASEWE
eukprot:2927827-Pleurochrysis_carterae.AAC.1